MPFISVLGSVSHYQLYHIFMNYNLISIHFVSPGSILGLCFFIVEQFLSTSYPDLLANWNNYIAIFREYCSARNLKGYTSVFFQVEDENVFLLEVDERYYNFTLSDIEGLCNSLSIALGCPFVCLHLVTVRGGSLIIYLYYSYSDYLTVFQSLTTEQLKMISQIKSYRILSLTDLHYQFRYGNIQSYAEVSFKCYLSSIIIFKNWYIGFIFKQ